MTGGPIAGRYTQTAGSDGNRDRHEVRLLAMPLGLFLRTRQHHDELLRELTLIALAQDDPAVTHAVTHPATHPVIHPLPGQLAALVETLGRRYAASASRADAVRDAAIERGDLTVDLSYHVPRSIAADLTMLGQMLDAADGFCRSGELLTLPRDDLMVAFGHWYTDEFVRQLDGSPPAPWDGPLT